MPVTEGDTNDCSRLRREVSFRGAAHFQSSRDPFDAS